MEAAAAAGALSPSTSSLPPLTTPHNRLHPLLPLTTPYPTTPYPTTPYYPLLPLTTPYSPSRPLTALQVRTVSFRPAATPRPTLRAARRASPSPPSTLASSLLGCSPRPPRRPSCSRHRHRPPPGPPPRPRPRPPPRPPPPRPSPPRPLPCLRRLRRTWRASDRSAAAAAAAAAAVAAAAQAACRPPEEGRVRPAAAPQPCVGPSGALAAPIRRCRRARWDRGWGLGGAGAGAGARAGVRESEPGCVSGGGRAALVCDAGACAEREGGRGRGAGGGVSWGPGRRARPRGTVAEHMPNR